VEDAQIIENKRNRLQKLIDAFENRADAFLLNHQSTDGVAMSSMADYAEYDHVDDIDDSGDLLGFREGESRIRTEAARSDAEVRIRAKDARRKGEWKITKGRWGYQQQIPFAYMLIRIIFTRRMNLTDPASDWTGISSKRRGSARTNETSRMFSPGLT
jgi:hypothetical protein